MERVGAREHESKQILCRRWNDKENGEEVFDVCFDDITSSGFYSGSTKRSRRNVSMRSSASCDKRKYEEIH